VIDQATEPPNEDAHRERAGADCAPADACVSSVSKASVLPIETLVPGGDAAEEAPREPWVVDPLENEWEPAGCTSTRLAAALRFLHGELLAGVEQADSVSLSAQIDAAAAALA
jgi:hypothetical protein